MAIILLILLLTPLTVSVFVTSPNHDYVSDSPESKSIVSAIPNEPVPLRRAAFVARDTNSYMDEFAYMAAVPSSVFLHSDTQYVSPLILTSNSDSESWFVDDWIDYMEPDGGITQLIGIGDLSFETIDRIQQKTGIPMFPRITGANSTEIAAQIAAMDWESSDIAVFALADDHFPAPTVTTGEASFIFQDSPISSFTSTETVSYGTISNITFTPPSSAIWMEGIFDWTTTDLHTHLLQTPSGEVVDYSVYSQVYFERNPSYVPSLVPLQFWYPRTESGTWTMAIERLSTGSTSLSCEVKYHPGFTQTVSVPNNAQWLNATISWDNTGTNLNLALVDPSGRLVQWGPAGSLISSGLTSETVQIPYPMAGDWTVLLSWIDASSESNNVDLSWRVSTLPSNLQAYLESAANGAVLASLMNAPLLYVTEDSVPDSTLWAAQRLGVSFSFLIDPANIHRDSLETALEDFSFLSSLDSYPLMTQWIQSLSGESDIIVTVPQGNADELFAPATYSGAFHGAPILSLCGDDNYITTRAEETWAPYMIGPEIEIYITTRWSTRTENGWYDERIPNKFSMIESVNVFADFLDDRGAYNSTGPQSVVIFSPPDLIKLSFDRSLQSHFQSGRIPSGNPSLASVFVNRASLHRFLFLTSESADDALLSFYAYTDGSTFVDNDYNSFEIWQIEDTIAALESSNFNILQEVGVDDVFAAINTELALWSLSTHGTLTNGPRDPPQRPGGQGLFSLRDDSAAYGFEVSLATRENPSDVDRLVNPVAYESEFAHHVMKTTDDLEAAIDNIGSPIVILTACLLGGTRLPIMLMEHGAVGVVASPRTVYFQPAGALSILMTEALCDGNSTGSALSTALARVSSDYSDPLLDREPRDYGNQQILFGDPEVHLYNPASFTRVSTVDQAISDFDGHTPGRGVPAVTAVGMTNSLPQTLSDLAIDYEFYDRDNLTVFEWLLPLRETVLVEPGILPSLVSAFGPISESLYEYVIQGGTLIMLGVSGDLSWMPWTISYSATGAGNAIAISDSTHPFMSSPNTIPSTIDYDGHFSSMPENLTVLATDGTDPLIIAGVMGAGKLALTTTHPNGVAWNQTVENAISWSSMPSLVLHDAILNQVIIWEGDRVIITLEITTRSGAGVEQVGLQVWLNSSELTVQEDGSGLYSITLVEEWTRGRVGSYTLRVVGIRAGYDTLTSVVYDFMTIRAFPWMPVALVGGVLAAIIGGSIYMRRRRGDRIIPKSRVKDKTREERRRQKEEDKKVDPKEFFGV